ncbi:BRO1-like domain-domain-containing protein [Leucosporidium creatinivorum]|uniref:BRO1-like domain-domain-containing protein n=1 Tax=Leucosporidium creatinivorum TaxID=106004 RepID=A0A1Y2FZ40_9BASI|nr:BRO1-like domain-domain-containing protein [Leucosporidium creatinivorum]
MTLNNLTAYYAQLSFLVTKLPLDVGASFPWYPAFSSPSGGPLSLGAFQGSPLVQLPNLQYERLCVLFNIAALHCSLAFQQRRSDQEGMKASIAAFQNAAGVLSHLLTLLPLLKAEPPALDPLSPDLSTKSIEALRDLCLAQAQEVFWQKGVMDRLKNGTIAKLAAQVAEFYGQASAKAAEAKGAGGVWPAFSFPESLVSHLMIKNLHFAAVAQYRKSVDDLGANRYGDELGRLEVADGYVNKALSLPKRGVADSVLKDLKSLQTILADNRARALKDNNLIYLEAITPLSLLPAIPPASMARPTPPPPIISPLTHLHSSPTGLGKPYFAALVPYEVHLALSLYGDRKDELMRVELRGKAEEMEAREARLLAALGLPGSIEAVVKPVGVPPSLVERAREVRSEGGVERLRNMLGDVRKVARVNQKIMNEAIALLAQEKEEDDSLRSQHGTDRWTRLSSEIAGAQLRASVQNFEGILSAAGESDLLVRKKFGEWEERIEWLGGDERTLESSIPRLADLSPHSLSTPSPQSTSLRTLRRLLDDLHSLRTSRQRTILEANSALTNDDIRPLIVKKAEEGLARVAQKGGELKLEMSSFEEVLQRELNKFEGFEREIKEIGNRQEDLLDQVKTANDAFIHARKTDPSLAAREQALQDLDLAFHMFREILTNLQEGLKFYSDLSKLVGEVRDGCKQWAYARSAEAKEQVQSLLSNAMSGTRISNVEQPAEGRAWRPEDGIRFG